MGLCRKAQPHLFYISGIAYQRIATFTALLPTRTT